MEVILKADVQNLGKVLDVVKVKDASASPTTTPSLTTRARKPPVPSSRPKALC